MSYTIWGESQYGKEELDEAEDLKEARYLVAEYKIAFGTGWRIWYARNRHK